MSDAPRFGTAGLADSYTVKKFDPAAIAAYTRSAVQQQDDDSWKDNIEKDK